MSIALPVSRDHCGRRPSSDRSQRVTAVIIITPLSSLRLLSLSPRLGTAASVIAAVTRLYPRDTPRPDECWVPTLEAYVFCADSVGRWLLKNARGPRWYQFPLIILSSRAGVVYADVSSTFWWFGFVKYTTRERAYSIGPIHVEMPNGNDSVRDQSLFRRWSAVDWLRRLGVSRAVSVVADQVNDVKCRFYVSSRKKLNCIQTNNLCLRCFRVIADKTLL